MDELNRDDEMTEESTTNMDVTFIAENDEYHQTLNFSGLDDDASPEFNIASTLTLKKNLTKAFDKHAGSDEEQDPHHAQAQDVKKSGVKAKIQAFERKNKKRGFDHSGNATRQKVRFNNPKPPMAPIPGPAPDADTVIDSNNTLSVYLRVRPPTASEESIQNDEEAVYNTVEIVKPDRGGNSTKIRTYPPKESKACKVVRGQHHLHSHSTNTELIFSKNSSSDTEGVAKGVKEFNFTNVFGPDASQSDIYSEVAVPLVDGLFPSEKTKMVGDKAVGKSALLFSYGITNAGKTYTIMGKDAQNKSQSQIDDSNPLHENHGIIPRTIHHILANVDELNNSASDDGVKYSLYMSYLEIYNEQVYDLLPKKTSIQSLKLGSVIADDPLKLREGRNGKIDVRGLTKYEVTSFSRGLELAQAAKKKRHTSSNNINSDSSRSHSICQFQLVAHPHDSFGQSRESASIASEGSGYATDDDSITSKKSKQTSVTLWIVDLAGSERSKRTGQFVGSARQKEARLINSSLMKLMRCFTTLKGNQTSNKISCVPFRESKLTHLFMGHLTGAAASRTSMIVNVNPSAADFDETQHVLAYATIAKTVQINQSEYSRKRQAIQMIGVKRIHTHSENGRPIKNEQKSPSKKISKVVRKLSPRAILKRRQEQKQKSLLQKRKEELESLRGVSGTAATKKGGSERPRKRITGNKRKLEDDMEELKEQLKLERQNAVRFKDESKSLKEKLTLCEAEIRRELAEETAAQFKHIREHHDSIVSRLKQQLHNSCQTPKSSKKARLDRADKAVDDLLDKVEEYEEEMMRMEDEHKQQIAQINSMVLEKDEALLNLQKRYTMEVDGYQKEITRLQSDLNDSQMQLKKLTQERDTLTKKITEQRERDSTSTLDSSLAELEEYSDKAISSDLSEKENRYTGRGTPSSTPRLRRLPRGRCSEVACANVSPPKDEPESSSKKHRGLRLIGLKSNTNAKSPFRDRPLKNNTSDQEADDLIYPSSQPDYDEITGLYLKPRGRAPNGRCWDSEEGGWRMNA